MGFFGAVKDANLKAQAGYKIQCALEKRNSIYGDFGYHVGKFSMSSVKAALEGLKTAGSKENPSVIGLCACALAMALDSIESSDPSFLALHNVLNDFHLQLLLINRNDIDLEIESYVQSVLLKSGEV
ncbi:hypothetical protein [Stutzerimonas stutzeri]|uniref:hypothetical protein n=1 Tax=Stutzerimonas stutzeri TaxID=316 RepID=UPI000F78B78D|nr:hypothetical protein [Stutzerimonas stutzeri]MCP3432122.1 hypothetical protein [Stutzerimonas stutzeri]RTM23975.1 hypothetical protein EKN22_07985 [Stutzerimonas stutzeri]